MTDIPLPHITAQAVLNLIQLFQNHGIQVWIDGGWAVDAVLSRETRPHEDLDLALAHADVPQLRQILEDQGFTDLPRDDTRDCNFVLAHTNGQQVDIHSFTFDADGHCIFGVPYPAASLTGKGQITGVEVDCIAPEWLLKFKTGYTLRAKDFTDVNALCEHFCFELPPKYR